MAELDRSGGRLLTVFMTLAALVIIASALVLALNPSMFAPEGSGLVGEVTIMPVEAAREGAQWRLVSHWSGAGAPDAEQSLYLIEFRSLPGWIAPDPVVLKKGQNHAQVTGVYKPVEYDEQTVMRIVGSPAMAYRLMPELVQRYLRQGGADDVRVLPGPVPAEKVVQGIYYSSRRIVNIEIVSAGIPVHTAPVNGSAEVSMFGLPAGDFDTEGADFSNRAVALGKDGIALVVHNENPVSSLSVGQIGEIFSGNITNWKQVGGPDRPIRLYILPEALDLSAQFLAAFMPRGASFAPSAHKVDVYVQLAEYVSQDPWSIGFTSTALTGLCRVLPVSTAAQDHAVSPSPQTISGFTYPAVRRLGLLAADSGLEQVRNFMAFCRTDAAQELVWRYGFVGNEPAPGAGEGTVADSDADAAEAIMTMADAGSGEALNRTAGVGTSQPGDGDLKVSGNSTPVSGVLAMEGENATESVSGHSEPLRAGTAAGAGQNRTAGQVPPESSAVRSSANATPVVAGAGSENATLPDKTAAPVLSELSSSITPDPTARDAAEHETSGDGSGRQEKSSEIPVPKHAHPADNATARSAAPDMPAAQDAAQVGAAPLPPLPAENGEVVPDEIRRRTLLPYWNAVKGAQRMPVVFGFETGSISLNAQALSDLDQVALLMKKPEYADKQIILVGFSDYSGTYASNLAISSVRASVVAQALNRHGVSNIQVIAAGEEEIIESSPSLAGREKNRRVEIWLK